MRFTAEFAIRHMILVHPEKTLATLMDWTSHDNHHVRRLVSEGSRPRLPWAMQLPQVIADPQLTLPLLEALRDDPSGYVRRSVANHLNDIAKDHPQTVLDLAASWHKNAPPERVRLLRRPDAIRKSGSTWSCIIKRRTENWHPKLFCGRNSSCVPLKSIVPNAVNHSDRSQPACTIAVCIVWKSAPMAWPWPLRTFISFEMACSQRRGVLMSHDQMPPKRNRGRDCKTIPMLQSANHETS